MRLAVLMTCHNRKDTTMRCLRGLLPQLGAEDRVYVVDDGSTDGTGEEIVRLFDCSIVRLIQGNGTLFWARGMKLAWETAAKEGDWDAYLWLNDDTELMSDALVKMRDVMRTGRSPVPTVVVGELENAQGEIVYGRRGDLFTGNFVCVPRNVCERVGMICGDYHHAWADTDYALRCKRLGVTVESCGVVGLCEGHPNRPSLKGLGLGERWRMLFDPKGWCVHDLWLYRRRNRGLVAAVFSSLHLVFHVLKGGRG